MPFSLFLSCSCAELSAFRGQDSCRDLQPELSSVFRFLELLEQFSSDVSFPGQPSPDGLNDDLHRRVCPIIQEVVLLHGTVPTANRTQVVSCQCPRRILLLALRLLSLSHASLEDQQVGNEHHVYRDLGASENHGGVELQCSPVRCNETDKSVGEGGGVFCHAIHQQVARPGMVKRAGYKLYAS